MNAADWILFVSLIALAVLLMLSLKTWRVLQEAKRRNERLKRVCAEYTAACEAAKRAGSLLPPERKFTEL